MNKPKTDDASEKSSISKNKYTEFYMCVTSVLEQRVIFIPRYYETESDTQVKDYKNFAEVIANEPNNIK